MNYPDGGILEQSLVKACQTTQHAAIIMALRDIVGVEKYGQTVDENPLKASDWAIHAMEEAADGLKYAIRAREEAEKLEMEVQALRTANAALVERVHAAEAVLTDPHALWTNWLRGTVRLPAGIGDIRQAEERVKRVLAAGDQMAAWLREPRNLGAVPFMADEWDEVKGQP